MRIDESYLRTMLEGGDLSDTNQQSDHRGNIYMPATPELRESQKNLLLQLFEEYPNPSDFLAELLNVDKQTHNVSDEMVFDLMIPDNGEDKP